MTPEQEREIRRAAEKFADSIFNSGPGRLTVPFLIRKHPELDAEEADSYLQFCRSQTIYHKVCYGDGSIMWPAWKAWIAELKSL